MHEMKLFIQLIYFLTKFILVFFITCFAFVLTAVADPGGPEGGFIYYLAAWNGSPTYSDGYYKLGNDLRVSTLVDLKNDDNGYLPIILIFDVPVYGKPDGTGDPTTTAITVVDVQMINDPSPITDHDIVIERVSRIVENGSPVLNKLLVDIKVPRSLFDDLPITVKLSVSENAVYSAEGVGNIAYGPIELNIVENFPSETPTFTRPTSDERKVKLIYFLPKDRSFNSQIPIAIDTQIKEAQSFFAENMALHGFGQKTFKIETDDNGTAVVHNFTGVYDGVYYHTNALSKTSSEIKERFDTSTDVYLIVLDTSIENIDGNCGISYYLGGPVIVPANGVCFRDRLGYILIAHELGHAFNLEHDFRDSSYLMSGASYTTNKLSTCASRVLDINPFFNQDANTIQTSNHHGKIRMVTERVYPLNEQHFTVKFEITDNDGIYQVQLLFPSYVINPEIKSDSRGLYDCRNFENAPSSETVEFYVPSEFLKYPSNNITIRVFDQYGNVTQKILTLISTKTFESVKSNNTGTFLTLTYHDPNVLVPINDKKEWTGWGDNLWEKTPDRRLSEKPQPFVYNVFLDAYNYWFYAHAQSSIIYDLSKGNYTKFEAFLLLPYPCESTSVELICLADDVEIYNSGVLSGSQVHNKRILSDIPEDTQMFTIRTTDAGDGISCDHFVLANARLFDADTPVPVSLSFFRPTLENGIVTIRWTTESELDNAGFNILRSIDQYGEYKQVNTQLIQGAGTTGERNIYKWIDTTAKQGVAYYYQIEDVSFADERQVLTTTRLKGLMSAKNKLKTTWSELKRAH